MIKNCKTCGKEYDSTKEKSKYCSLSCSANDVDHKRINSTKMIGNNYRFKGGLVYDRSLYQTRIYRCWSNMINRCYNEKFKDFYRYGGRGIRVCDRWRESFKNFYDDMKDGYNDLLTIERVDVNGNYNKENCVWANKKQQAINRRNTRLFEYKGQKKTLIDWSRELGIKRSTLSMRFYKYHFKGEEVFRSVSHGR